MSNDGMPTGRDLQICVPIFRKLFNLGKERLKRINEKSRKPLPGAEDVPVPRGSDHKLSEKQKEELQAILETEPRMSSHYAPQDEDNSRKYYYSGGLSRFYFWTKYLETNDCESDTEFVAQCKRVHFWETYQRVKRVRRKPDYSLDSAGMRLQPSISYGAACASWRKFDIKFESRKCDICSKCFRLKCEYDRTVRENAPAADRDQAKTMLLRHQTNAQLAVWVRTEWKRAVVTGNGRREMYQVDFAANPRTPYMELGQAFYNRILGVSVFVVVSTLLQTFVYMFDERTAKKGSDEVISCITMLLRDKLPWGVASVDICCDGCAGQSWNNRLALFLEEIVDPESGKSLLKLFHCCVLLRSNSRYNSTLSS
jgi:hypothetical protein